MKNRKGFSIVELLIVVAILGVALSVASLSWQSYVTKTNLRSGARKVASDLTKYRTRAIGEGRVYTITFNAADKYNISAPAQDNFAAVNISETPIEASGAQDAVIEDSNFTGCHVVRMTPRGLVGHCNPQVANQSDTGTVTLKNSRDVTATITLNSRGTVDVTFTDNKGMGMVEVMIAIFLTTTAIFAAFSLQSPAWKSAAKADYLGRGSEIMHRQLESTEAYIMNQCNTVASAANGIPAIPGAGASANSNYDVFVSGLAAATLGDATYHVVTEITALTDNYFRITVTVTWPPLNATGINQTIFVSRQQYFKNGC